MKQWRSSAWAGLVIAAALLSAPGSLAQDQNRIPAVIAEFDNYDTSGEAGDHAAEHAARVHAFAGLLRDKLTSGGKYDVLALNCPEPTCSAGSMNPDDLVQAARRSGARLLVYGGIHKMSTLVQWGKVNVVDLEKEELLLDRSFSFRGDTDVAFRRAAAFIVRYLEDAAPKS